jgi:hypothetical protein
MINDKNNLGRAYLSNPSLKIADDIRLVNIIEDWGVLEEYAGEKLSFYQLLATDGKIEFKS